MVETMDQVVTSTSHGRGLGRLLPWLAIAFAVVGLSAYAHALRFSIYPSTASSPVSDSLDGLPAFLQWAGWAAPLHFLIVGLVLLGMVRLLKGSGTAKSVLSWLLLIYVVQIITLLIAPLSSTTYDWLYLNGFLGAWMGDFDPLAGIFVLTGVVVARYGGRLPWPQAFLTGICIALTSFIFVLSWSWIDGAGITVPTAFAMILRV